MSEVFSSPRVPIPDMDEFSKFFSDFISDLPGGNNNVSSAAHQPMLMQQPPEQPLFDTPHSQLHHFDATTPTLLVKQEQETGFLQAWDHLCLGQGAGQEMEMEMERFSPEEHKRIESSLVREELHCLLKLKMMKEGKELSSEAEDQTMQQDCSLSEETLELQRVRRLKNREAAKKCRQKKRATEREQEQKLREAEKEVRDLKLQVQQSQLGFYTLLENFPNMTCFLAYLRQNRRLVSSPALKPVLQKFVQTHGGRMQDNAAGCKAAAAPAADWCLSQAALPVQQGSRVEQ